MGKKKRLKVVDSELLLEIESAAANGADTNAKLASAIGWAASTFKNYRYGKGGEQNYVKYVEPIETAIKKGAERRRKKLISLAEDALAELMRYGEYEEREVSRRPVGQPTAEGGQQYVVTNKVTKKYKHPNATAAIFVAVNMGDGRWKSVNNIRAGASADVINIAASAENDPADIM